MQTSLKWNWTWKSQFVIRWLNKKLCEHLEQSASQQLYEAWGLARENSAGSTISHYTPQQSISFGSGSIAAGRG